MFDPSDFAGKKPSIACELSCGRVLPSSSTLPLLSKISLVHPRLRIYSTDSVQKMLLPNAVGLVERGKPRLKRGRRGPKSTSINRGTFLPSRKQHHIRFNLKDGLGATFLSEFSICDLNSNLSSDQTQTLQTLSSRIADKNPDVLQMDSALPGARYSLDGKAGLKLLQQVLFPMSPSPPTDVVFLELDFEGQHQHIK
ncbi:uncharacterized protein K444DRAFT_705624 [Hyaloscypha bicolor E]|uniref:Uncharacterized protein n=1 Tax=Hyaloscypha bicolor E TaxID=1095630 RepID=A0A2J6TPL9_9HELO|nr:uncharacterized protein K444DRAFT_705624 [Hyaloscypha bicolor E]PMD64960.1 hypothetical protein K444DRAFT_705624 [Hyaloscypha bicolor E]